MAYNSGKGTQKFGDINYEGDPAETQIDFEDDLIALKTNNVQRLIVSSSAITASVIFSASAGVYAGSYTGDGAGLTGIPASGLTAAGSTTQVQYNNSNAFAGSANMVFDGTTLTVAGLSSTGNSTLGDASGDSVTINAATVDIPNVAAGTDNTVVVYNGSTLLTDEIDSRVWSSNLAGKTGTPVATQVAIWTDIKTAQGLAGLTYDGTVLAVTGNISASINISASAFYGDGSNLTNTGVVTSYTNATDNRVLTSTGAGGITGEVNLTFDGNTLTGSVTGSLAEFSSVVAGAISGSGNISGSAFYGDGSNLSNLPATGISWDGSTANGVATYKDADEATVESNLTFDGVTLVVAGDALIDKDYTGANAATVTGLEIDFDKTSATTSNNTMYGIKVDMDNTTATDGANTMYGLHVTPTLTHAAAAGNTLVYGALINAQGGTNGTSFVQAARFEAGGGDINYGIQLDIEDGGVDLRIESSADSGDYFQIQTTTHGATTITTQDDNATAAHLTFDVDGDITLDPAGSVKISSSTLDIGTGVDSDAMIHVSGSDSSVLAIFETPSNPIAMAITGSGKVAVGGMHLDAKLNVSGSKNDKLLSLKSDTQNPAFYASGSGDVYAAGKIGIGTYSPEIPLDVNGNAIRIRTAGTPSSASDFGTQGEIRWDADYIYVCVATDTWKRVAIGTW